MVGNGMVKAVGLVVAVICVLGTMIIEGAITCSQVLSFRDSMH